MSRFDILLKSGEVIETATFEIHRQKSSLTLIRKNGFRKTYIDHDLLYALLRFDKNVLR